MGDRAAFIIRAEPNTLMRVANWIGPSVVLLDRVLIGSGLLTGWDKSSRPGDVSVGLQRMLRDAGFEIWDPENKDDPIPLETVGVQLVVLSEYGNRDDDFGVLQ